MLKMKNCNWFILIFLLSLIFTSCGGREIVVSRGLTNSQVFRINDRILTLPEAKVLLINYQNIYGNIQSGREGTINLWALNSGEDDSRFQRLEQYVKDLTLSQLAQIAGMNLLARREEISLTEEEHQAVRTAANAYFSTLTPEELEYTEATLETIETMYSQYGLANKLFHQLTSQIQEVSDDEARIMIAQKIFVVTPERVAEVSERLAQGSDFLSVATTYNEEGEVNVTFGRGTFPEAVEQAVFAMENGDVIGPIEVEGGFYFFRCIDKYNRELTDENKLVIMEERKKAAFHDVYQAFIRGLSSDLNERLWERVRVEDKEGIVTRSFFTTYEEYCHW